MRSIFKLSTIVSKTDFEKVFGEILVN